MTKPRQRTRADWGAARARYVALGPQERSFERIAREYHVTGLTVRKHARAEGWAKAAADADAEVARRLLAQSVKDRAQRALQDARIRDLAGDRVEQRLDADDVSDDWIRQVLADADKRVRLNEGEATDNVAIAEVQAGFRASMQTAIDTVAVIAGELLEPDKAAELVRVFRARFLPAVNEALAIGAGDQ